MSDKLSQKEIDALLSSISSGEAKTIEEQKSEVKPYNFARPSKINKEQLRAFEIVFDNFSRVASSFLTGYLRTNVSIEVSVAEPVIYSEFSSILINPVILVIMELAPLKGSIIMEMSANLGYAIIERILGGTGNGLKKIREFSDLEKVLLEKVIAQALTFLPEAWSNVADITPRIEKLETNSQFAQIISPNEINALITLNMKIGPIEGFMNFCIPHLVIEPVMDRLNTRAWYAAKKALEDEVNPKVMEDKLQKANVSVRAIIGKSTVTVSDFVNLQVGDILTLDTFTTSDLDVIVGGKSRFRAKPGISRGKNAVQITSLIESEG